MVTFVAAPNAQAQEQNGPVIESISFTPASIDVTTGSKTVTATVRITDKTGLDGTPSLVWGSDVSEQGSGFLNVTRTSGDAKDGTYTASHTFGPNTTAGTWSLTVFPLDDTNGYSNGGFSSAPTKLQVARDESTPTPPPATDLPSPQPEPQPDPSRVPSEPRDLVVRASSSTLNVCDSLRMWS